MSDFGSPPASASMREPSPPPRTTICGGQADLFRSTVIEPLGRFGWPSLVDRAYAASTHRQP